MGISRGAIKLIAMALKDRTPGGTVLTFGVQSVDGGRNDVIAAMASANNGSTTAASEPLGADASLPGQRIHQRELFSLLGFAATESLDCYDAESPTHIVDLNRPLPPALRGRFDLVYDGGTIEHCFNAPQAMMNVVSALAPGGRVIHHVPMNNWVDHGFYQLSPTVFFDFYDANGFIDPRMKLHFMGRRRESFAVYDPENDPRLPYSFGSKMQCLSFFTAEKSRDAGHTEIVFPLQRRYREAFGGETKARPRKRGFARLKDSILKRTIRLRASRI
ncbi:MAG: hypothetical protein ACKVQT_17615 [Burkholderiales bacterium]